MIEIKAADRGDIRDRNIIAVIDALRRLGSTTRAHVAREIGLSAPTVSAVIAVLAKAGVVGTTGTGPATGGRRGELVRLEPRARVVAGLDLSSTPRRFGLLDLNNELVGGTLAPIPGSALKSPGELGHWLSGQLREHSNVIGVGVAVPGVTSSTAGVVEWAPSLNWRNAALKNELRAAIPGLVVVVENDLNLAALAEHALARGKWSDLALLGLRGGLGAGIILGGALHRGAHFAAGEVGYLPGPFGERGTLDFGALETLLFSKLPGQPRPHGRGYKRSKAAPERAAGLEVSDILAFGCFALAVVLDVPAIILGDELMALEDDLDRTLEKRLKEALPHAPEVMRSKLGANGTLRGAGVAVQQCVQVEVRRLLA